MTLPVLIAVSGRLTSLFLSLTRMMKVPSWRQHRQANPRMPRTRSMSPLRRVARAPQPVPGYAHALHCLQ